MTPAAAPLPATPHDLRGVRRAYLVGIGGVGLSGAARLLMGRGIEVIGSDRDDRRAAAALTALGVHAPVTADDIALPADIDLLVHSAAIPATHPQRREAEQRGLPTWRYADLLGALMAEGQAICVAGCHGKTTTSSMLASALMHAEHDPSFLVGGTLRGMDVGARVGAGTHFVAESCEFDRSFHAHRPRVAIVTNVDEDHLDYYADLAEIQESFRVFASRLPADGRLIVNDAHAAVFAGDARLRAPLTTYGFAADADWQVGEVELQAGGRGIAFDLHHLGRFVGRARVPMLGRHNALNATAAIAAMVATGVEPTAALEGIAAFAGVGRRLESIVGEGPVLVYDDYGHHPAEIRAVVRALRQRHGEARLCVVFQPHQASRTRCLMKDFAAALAEADAVWMPPIFFARDSEEARRSVTSEDLARHIGNEGGTARTMPDLEAVIEHALTHLCPGDVLVTMGAGNIDEVAHGLAARL